MFKVHKKVKYALLALKYLKEKPEKELISAKEICGKFDIPFDPTCHVLQLMAQNGILEAAQGTDGGYRLVGDLNKLTIFDLSQMIRGPFALAQCGSEETEYDVLDDCILKDTMNRLNVKLLTVLRAFKVSEMI